MKEKYKVNFKPILAFVRKELIIKNQFVAQIDEKCKLKMLAQSIKWFTWSQPKRDVQKQVFSEARAAPK